MSTYKVLQDVEAEDKLIGPLSLRQFIYAGISAISLYLCYFLSTHHAAFMIAVFLPIAGVGAFFAFPWGKDQPTEVWALAKIRFLIKPRRRIWDQSGVKELVTITAPIHQVVDYTNGLSENEVQSRLRALADTIDSRGWAVKNANLNLYSQQSPLVMAEPASDRLVAPSSLPQAVENVDVRAADDILDETNNASAQRLDTMINESAKAHRERIVENLKKEVPAQPEPPKPANYWFLNQPAPAANIPSNMVTFNTQVVTPGSTEAQGMTEPVQDEANIVAQLEARRQKSPDSTYYGHLHTIQPLSVQAKQHQQASAPTQPPAMAPLPDMPAVRQAQPVPAMPMDNNTAAATPVSQPAQAAPAPVTPASQAAILQLASNDDLNVATIAREAERAAPQNEVVIKLH